MPHVLRDRDGRIMAVLDRPSAGPTEDLPMDDPELLAFLEGLQGGADDAGGGTDSQQRAFLRADLEFIRVLEDLVGALMERNVIALSDLPPDAQRKILGRAALRQMLNQRMPIIGSEETETLF